MTTTRPILLIASCLVLLCACGQRAGNRGNAGSTEAAAEARGRLIVLGFDGVDPRWLDRWAREGRLPNLQRLISAHGGQAYRHLRSTNPPQSPVAWTSFATGTNPGSHGIFDFIARRLSRASVGPPVMPQVATNSFEVQEAGPPVVRNLRSGEPFWQTLGNSGVRVVALNVPYSYPPDPMRDGRMLSGLGVPDLRETNSTFTYAGTEVTPQDPHPGGGVMVPMAVTEGVGRFSLEGPSIPGGRDRMSLPVEVRARGTDALVVKIGAQEVTAPLRDFSEWVHVAFTHGGTTVHGMLQLVALEAAPRMRLFITPISFDPRHQYSPIAYPQRFAAELAEDLHGDYKTVGWDHDTSALNAEVIDEDIFLRDMNNIETQRAAMLTTRLARNDWDLFLWVSTATDRVAHMFYRLIDPEHPRYEAALAARHGNAIQREYERMDRTVGRVVAMMRPNDTLLILSDHGFHNYRRGLHVNQWLREQGLLFLKNDAPMSDREFLLDVDWTRTKAYAIGTGQIYLNIRGRERDGIVNEGDVPALRQQIRQGLIALRDVERGNAQPVSEVYVGATAYRGGRLAEAPDLQIGFAENYRTSWETVLGGVPAGNFADNTRKWSGDHSASDVDDTDGILISNRPIRAQHPAIIDLAPTATQFFERPRPRGYEGVDVFSAAPPTR